MGRRIRVREVRVIDSNGEQLGIMPTADALAHAESQGLQLVEVNPKTNPPVCKILDYGKFKYETAKRDREAKKHKKSQELKEVKFRPKIGDHDYDFKVKHARRFLEEGHKVRLLVQFRGREVVHPETGRAILDRDCKDLADVATIVQIAAMEANRIGMILGPKPKREGGGVKKPAPAKPAEEGAGAEPEDETLVDAEEGTLVGGEAAEEEAGDAG